MARFVRSAKGELVDFDLLKMKFEAEQLATQKLAKPSTVLTQTDFMSARIAAAQSKKELVAAMSKTSVAVADPGPDTTVVEAIEPQIAPVQEVTPTQIAPRKIKRDNTTNA